MATPRRRSSAPLAAALSAALATGCFREPPSWPEVLADVRARYPDVPQVSVESLRASMDSDRPLLLDARAAPEFAVSHLPGALPAPDEPAALRVLSGTPPEREILVYCSVGMRSSALADELRARGFTRTANLEGGLFAWANAGLPMVRTAASGAEEPATLVHPFDTRWGTLLAPERRGPLD